MNYTQEVAVEVYKFGHIGLRKIFGYVHFGVIILGIGSMIKGPVGSNESLYSRYDVPVGVYVLTIIAVIVVAIIYLNSIFSPLRPIGSVEVGTKELVIKLKKTVKKIPYTEIKELSIQLEYHHDKVDPVKNNRRLLVKGTDYDKILDIILDQVQEEKLKEQIKSVGLG